MPNYKSKYLENIRKIKEWMKQNKTTKPPTASAKNTEERKLGQMISNIRQNVIKPFNLLNTDEERTEFLKKHKGAEEVIEIVNWIDTNNVPVKLQQAREIKRWMEERDTKKPPRIKGTEVSQEEKRLGRALDAIRQYMIKPYKSLKNEEERRKFEEKYPEIIEILEIINLIDMKNNVSINLEHARKIKEWMENNNTKIPPSSIAEDETEKRLGQALSRIRKNLIKPLRILRTKEEREEFIKRHPDINEIMEIVEKIDENDPRRKKLELAKKAKDEVRRKNGEAKALQEKVQEELSKREISK